MFDNPAKDNVPVLPAYAGMIRHSYLPFLLVMSAPRVCGDDPAIDAEAAALG